MAKKRKPQIKKKCKHCNKAFEVPPSLAKRIFCCAKCKYAHGREPIRVTVVCLTCGKEFDVRPFEAKKRNYCSRNCSNKRDPNQIVKKECRNCGKEFSYTDYGKSSIYCSKKCHLEDSRRKSRRCPQCNKEYVPKKHADQKYCSPKCQGLGRRARSIIKCHRCKKEIEVVQSRKERTKYCSEKCQLMSMFSSEEEHKIVNLVAYILNEEPLEQHTFPWLKSDTGRNLILDAYFPACNLALEYDGKQHTKFTPFYHKTHKQFERAQERDRIKEKLLAANNIPLIRISYDEPKTKQYISQKLSDILNGTGNS